MPETTRLSEIGAKCAAITRLLASGCAAFGLNASRAPEGALLLSAERDTPRSCEAGALTAALCQGGLAVTDAYTADFGGRPHPFVRSRTDRPRLAALELQSACAFEGVMLSGPVKLLLERVGDVEYGPDPSRGALTAVIQADNPPGGDWIRSLAARVSCAPSELTLLVAPQESMLGAAQIAGRMNENMLFTMERSLGLDGAMVAVIEGTAPVCPPGSRTKSGKRLLPDDFLHYGAFSRLTIDAPAGFDAQKLADDLAFESLDIFGALFADLLDQAGGDFFKIPNLLHINKLAAVEVFDRTGGRTYRAGKLRPDLI